MGKRVLRYFLSWIYGAVPMMILLNWHTQSGWRVSITPYTAWVFLSWLLCYPWLRGQLGYLFLKPGKNRRMTSNGVTSYPWQYAIGSTRSVGEIFSLIYIFGEHLLVSFLLILFGPLVTCTLFLMTLLKRSWLAEWDLFMRLGVLIATKKYKMAWLSEWLSESCHFLKFKIELVAAC